MAGTQVLSEMAEQPDVLAASPHSGPAARPSSRGALPRGCVAPAWSPAGPATTSRCMPATCSSWRSALPVASVAPSVVTRYHRALDVRDTWSSPCPSQAAPRRSSMWHPGWRRPARWWSASPTTRTPRWPRLRRDADAWAPSKELAVPATKTVTGQLALVTLLAEAVDAGLADYTGGDRPGRRCPTLRAGAGRRTRDRRCGGDPARRADRIHLARGLTYAAALEGALKCKETSRRVHEGYSSADFLHGPLTVASPEVAVIAYGATGPVLADVAETVRAAVDLGSPVIGIGAPEVWPGCRTRSACRSRRTWARRWPWSPWWSAASNWPSDHARSRPGPGLPEGLNKVTATH